MAQSEGADGRFTADRERFRKEFVQAFALFDALLETLRFGLQGLVAECFETGFQLVDALDVFLEIAQVALVAAAEKFGKQLIEHGWTE
jgi:hypothetical protein